MYSGLYFLLPSTDLFRFQKCLILMRSDFNNKTQAKYSFSDHENGEESAQNYKRGSCQWSQGSWDHSHQENN